MSYILDEIRELCAYKSSDKDFYEVRTERDCCGETILHIIKVRSFYNIKWTKTFKESEFRKALRMMDCE